MRTLDPERWRRLRPLLDEALELPDAARAAFLDRACGDDRVLRDELAALLAADERAESGGADARWRQAVDSAARALLAGAPAAEPGAAATWIGRTIGPYRIVGLLGEGGMGIVFEAEQSEPRRTVALKVVRGGALVDEARLRLFRREIEALARLQHPAIATIHDAGRTEDGQHFFAMERVRGRPLDEHLRARPDPAFSRDERRQRLALFLELCDAIAYAHQRGVIHRDLKPSNVVVADAPATPPSGAAPPRLKVLDFGLARITDGDVALTTLGPGPRAIEGTLPYMSPEQARGAADAIDTRSDVYALGVILHEMLTGARPYDVGAGALHEGLRVICETPPARPSARVPALRGDLDTIVLKALEKEPSARYPTVAALAEDVRRTLADLPIAARPPGMRETLRKAARRHRVAAAFGAVIAATLVLGAAGTTVGMLRARAAEREAERRAAEAREEARTAESVSRFLVDLFQSSNPDSASTSRLTARELLELGTARIDTALADQPRVRGRLYHVLGTVNRDLGFHHRARLLLTRAVELRRATLGPDHPDVATSEYVLAGLLRRLGEFEEAERRYRRALDIRLRALGPAHRDVAGSYAGLANVLLERGDYAAARPLQERALATIERAVGPEDAAVTMYLYNLALLEHATGDAARARGLLERAIRIEERALGPAHPSLAPDLSELGAVLRDLGDLPAARARMRRALAICEDALGPAHPRTTEVVIGLAITLDASGDAAGAEALARRAIDAFSASLGPTHARTAEAEDVLASALAHRGRLREAEALSSRALASLRAALGPRHDGVARVLSHRGAHRLALGDTAAACHDLREALAIQREVLPDGHPDRRATERLLAPLR